MEFWFKSLCVEILGIELMIRLLLIYVMCLLKRVDIGFLGVEGFRCG